MEEKLFSRFGSFLQLRKNRWRERKGRVFGNDCRPKVANGLFCGILRYFAVKRLKNPVYFFKILLIMKKKCDKIK